MVEMNIMFCKEYVNEVAEVVQEYLMSIPNIEVEMNEGGSLFMRSAAMRDLNFLVALATAFIAPMDCYMARRVENKGGSRYIWAQLVLGSSEEYDLEQVRESVECVLENYGEVDGVS